MSLIKRTNLTVLNLTNWPNYWMAEGLTTFHYQKRWSMALSCGTRACKLMMGNFITVLSNT